MLLTDADVLLNHPGPSPEAKPESPVSHGEKMLKQKPLIAKYNISDVSSPQASAHSHLRIQEKSDASQVQPNLFSTQKDPKEAKLAEPVVQHRGSDLLGSCSVVSKDQTNKILPATSSTSTHKADPAPSPYRMRLITEVPPATQKISGFDPAGKNLDPDYNNNLLGKKLVSSNTELFENDRSRSNSLAFKRRRLLSESNQEKLEGQSQVLFQSRASGIQMPTSARKSVSMQHPALERLDPVSSKKPDGQSQVFSISNNDFQDSPLYRVSRFNKGLLDSAKEPQSAQMRIHYKPSSKQVLIPEEQPSDRSNCADSEPGEQSFLVDIQREEKLSANPLKRFSEKIKKKSKGAQEFSSDKKYKQLLNIEI